MNTPCPQRCGHWHRARPAPQGPRGREGTPVLVVALLALVSRLARGGCSCQPSGCPPPCPGAPDSVSAPRGERALGERPRDSSCATPGIRALDPHSEPGTPWSAPAPEPPSCFSGCCALVPTPSRGIQRCLVVTVPPQSSPAASPVQSSVPSLSCASCALGSCSGCARDRSPQEPLPPLFNASVRSKETTAIKAPGSPGNLCSGQTPCQHTEAGPAGPQRGEQHFPGLLGQEGHTANPALMDATSPAGNNASLGARNQTLHGLSLGSSQ